jgi:hypothetical protein
MARNVLHQRKQPDLSQYVQASIDRANGVFDPETGHYAELIYAGIETPERAKEIRQALFRAAGYLKVSMNASVEKYTEEKTHLYRVRYKAINKAHARAYILAKHGPDRAAWPYSPRKGDSNYG